MQAKAKVHQPVQQPAAKRRPAPESVAEDTLQAQAISGHSPAVQLQNMLVERLNVAEATALKTDKYDVRIRLAIIIGISAGGWGLVLLAARGAYALLMG